jgi:hypothetical protein
MNTFALTAALITIAISVYNGSQLIAKSMQDIASILRERKDKVS